MFLRLFLVIMLRSRSVCIGAGFDTWSAIEKRGLQLTADRPLCSTFVLMALGGADVPHFDVAIWRFILRGQ